MEISYRGICQKGRVDAGPHTDLSTEKQATQVWWRLVQYTRLGDEEHYPVPNAHLPGARRGQRPGRTVEVSSLGLLDPNLDSTAHFGHWN